MKLRPALFAILCAPACACAVVGTTSTSDPGGPDTHWTWVGQVNGASAVAVGPRTVLTAAHVGAGDFSLGGVTYGMLNAMQAPDVTVGSTTSHTDIELINLTSDLPGFYNLATSTTAGEAVTMVGYGESGVVNGSGVGYDINVGGGTRRAANNVFDGAQLVDPVEGISDLSLLRNAGDAALAVGDSGGGWFDGAGNLIGVSAFFFNETNLGQTPAGDNPPPAQLPDYGFTSSNPSGWSFHNNQPGWVWDIDIPAGSPYFGSGAIDVTNSTIHDWITANSVPEPASLVALGLGLVGLLRVRRSRKSRKW